MGSAKSNVISGNQIYSNHSQFGGIMIYQGRNTLVSNNTIYGQGPVTAGTATNVGAVGIYVYQSTNNVIKNNKIYNCTNAAIELWTFAQANIVASNQLYNSYYSSGTRGIFIDSTGTGLPNAAPNYNVITKNNIYGFNKGIHFKGASYNIVGTNNIYNNVSGIYFNYWGTNNYFCNNQIYSNSRFGIYMSTNLIINTVIRSNKIYGPNQAIGNYIYMSKGTTNYGNILNNNTNGFQLQKVSNSVLQEIRLLVI